MQFVTFKNNFHNVLGFTVADVAVIGSTANKGIITD